MKTHRMIVNPEIRHQLAVALHDIRCLYKVYPFLGKESRERRLGEREALRYGADNMAYISQLYAHDSKASSTITNRFPLPR